MENVSGTVNKAIDILDIFLKRKGEVGLTELSELTGYNTSTVYRLLSTMVKRGLLSQEKKKGKYSLGAKTIAFGFVARLNLNYLDTLYLHLSKLCHEHNVAVNVTVLHDGTALVIDEIGIANDFRVTALVGKQLPLHATAAGKIHLAYMSTEERKIFYSLKPLELITPKTMTSIGQIEKELEIVKREGIAFDQEEHILGTWAIAAPLFANKSGILATASAIVPVTRIDAYRSQQLVSALKSCATEISLVLSRTV
jgi:DNA-binding IclR family transcriptional regulator